MRFCFIVLAFFAHDVFAQSSGLDFSHGYSENLRQSLINNCKSLQQLGAVIPAKKAIPSVSASGFLPWNSRGESVPQLELGRRKADWIVANDDKYIQMNTPEQETPAQAEERKKK